METGREDREVNAMLPARVKRATKGVGSFLNIYFSLYDAEAHLWIYLCHWELIDGTHKVETSSSISNEATVAQFFSGESLLSLETEGPEVRLILSEAKKLVLHADRNEYGDEDLLILYIPGRPPFGYGPVPGSSSDYGWNTDDSLP